MDINQARKRYANLRNEATRFEGWTKESFDARVKVIAEWFIGRGESKPEAYLNAATEVLDQEIREAAIA